MNQRRNDIDALRVIAIALLLVYHVALGFQSWGFMVGFITNPQPLDKIWPAMAMLNVWRIPLLFFISGMGVFFSLKRRNLKQLLLERTKRIFLPLVFGSLAIVPIHIFILQKHYLQDLKYHAGMGHLWFLGNIFIYVLMLSPLFIYVLKKEKIANAIQKIFSKPYGLLIVLLSFIAEVLIIHPNIYTMYAMQRHGFFLGFLAFLYGYIFAQSGTPFWEMLVKKRWGFLAIASILYVNRLMAPQMNVHNVLQVMETNFWIFTIFSFGYRYLRNESQLIQKLSTAAYPVYIFHMIPLYLSSYFIFGMELSAWIKLAIVLISTFAGSYALYWVVSKIKWIRPLFGLKF